MIKRVLLIPLGLLMQNKVSHLILCLTKHCFLLVKNMTICFHVLKPWRIFLYFLSLFSLFSFFSHLPLSSPSVCYLFPFYLTFSLSFSSLSSFLLSLSLPSLSLFLPSLFLPSLSLPLLSLFLFFLPSFSLSSSLSN